MAATGVAEAPKVAIMAVRIVPLLSLLQTPRLMERSRQVVIVNGSCSSGGGS